MNRKNNERTERKGEGEMYVKMIEREKMKESEKAEKKEREKFKKERECVCVLRSTFEDAFTDRVLLKIATIS